jgi:hypothetical protein
MKLFLTSYLAISGLANEKRPTRRQNMIKWWNGEFNAKTDLREVSLCPPLDLPENAAEVVYTEGSGRIEQVAEAMCLPGYFPDLSRGKKLKTKCKMMKKAGRMSYQWIRPLPKCVTCTVEDPTRLILRGEKDVDVFCTVRGNNEKRCLLTCKDDRKKLDHEIFSTEQKRANIDCRCKRGECLWTSHGHQDIPLNGFSCQAPGELEPIVPPVGCGKSTPECTVVTPKVDRLNSWTCRNCFRIRAFYKFRSFDIKDFDNQDYLDITFSEQVFWIKHSHPAFEATDIGNNTWRVRFSPMAMFSNKEMDFSAELRAVTPRIPELVVAKSCPCSA